VGIFASGVFIGEGGGNFRGAEKKVLQEERGVVGLRRADEKPGGALRNSG